MCQEKQHRCEDLDGFSGGDSDSELSVMLVQIQPVIMWLEDTTLGGEASVFK